MKIRLSLSPSYCPNWGTWEAVRELVQNWLDARDQGFEGEIWHDAKSNTLYLANTGTVLTKAQLGMLGETTKADNTELRGQWGEGLKIAALVIAREGRELVIDSGEFRYTAIIDHSEEFGKDCLTWSCRHLAKSRYEGIRVSVSNISKEMWNTYRNNFIALRENKPEVEKNYYGNILRNPEDKGRIFVKGIFVNKDDKLSFGYDFNNAKIDRDRKMVEDFNLTYNIGWILNNELAHGRLTATELMNLIQAGSKDTAHVNYHISSDSAETLSHEFTRVYGENAVPVQNHEEMVKVGHFGLKGVIVPQVLYGILDKTDIGMVNAMRKVATIDFNPCTINELDAEQTSNVREVMDLLSRSNLAAVDVEMAVSVDSLTFVDFKDEKLLGTFCQGKIKLSRRILGDKSELLTTLVEEIAHEKGADGSHAHKMQIHAIYNAIIRTGLKAF